MGMKKERMSKGVLFVLDLSFALVILILVLAVINYLQKPDVADPHLPEFIDYGVLSLDEAKQLDTTGKYIDARICQLPWHIIEYIDRFNVENCIAIKNVTFSDKLQYQLSMNDTEMPSYSDFENLLNIHCDSYTSDGRLWCLRDKSACYQRDGDVCTIFEKKEVEKH